MATKVAVRRVIFYLLLLVLHIKNCSRDWVLVRGEILAKANMINYKKGDIKTSGPL